MVVGFQQFPVSGLIEGGVTGSQTLVLNLLCGISNGSVIVPLSCSATGQLSTVSGTL